MKRASSKPATTTVRPRTDVRSDDKRKARLNTIAHLLPVIPYENLPDTSVKLPARSRKR